MKQLRQRQQITQHSKAYNTTSKQRRQHITPIRQHIKQIRQQMQHIRQQLKHIRPHMNQTRQTWKT